LQKNIIALGYNMLTIEEVKTPKDFKEFLNFPWKLYKNTPEWIAPLKMELNKRLNPAKSSFYKRGKAKLLLAKKDGKIVGRMSVSIDKNNLKKEKEREGSFGCFEVINDKIVSDTLLNYGISWLRSNKVSKVTGPIHFTLEDPYPGLLIEGFENRPYFMMTYSLPYYPECIERFGFKTTMDLNCYDVSKERPLPDTLLNKAEQASNIKGLKLREINLKKIYEEAEIIRDIFNEALRKNWGHIPFSKNYARKMANDLKMLADPRIIFIAEVDEKPVGSVINLPNYNELFSDLNGRLFPRGFFRVLTKKKKIKSLRGYAMAVRDAYQGSGLGCLMLRESFAAGIKAGYEQGEITWILGNNNSMNSLAELSGGKQNKTYRLYEMEI